MSREPHPESRPEPHQEPHEGEEPHAEHETADPMLNIRDLSVRCGQCERYLVLTSYRPVDDEWNEYGFEGDCERCVGNPERSRVFLEVPADLDEFARRDPTWHGGRIHAGAETES